MANLQIRNFSDDIYKQLQDIARDSERSIEGQARFMLIQAIINSALPDVIPVSDKINYAESALGLPTWMYNALAKTAKTGFRPVKSEVIMRLTQSLAADGITETDDTAGQ